MLGHWDTKRDLAELVECHIPRYEGTGFSEALYITECASFRKLRPLAEALDFQPHDGDVAGRQQEPARLLARYLFPARERLVERRRNRLFRARSSASLNCRSDQRWSAG